MKQYCSSWWKVFFWPWWKIKLHIIRPVSVFLSSPKLYLMMILPGGVFFRYNYKRRVDFIGFDRDKNGDLKEMFLISDIHPRKNPPRWLRAHAKRLLEIEKRRLQLVSDRRLELSVPILTKLGPSPLEIVEKPEWLK